MCAPPNLRKIMNFAVQSVLIYLFRIMLTIKVIVYLNNISWFIFALEAQCSLGGRKLY